MEHVNGMLVISDQDQIPEIERNLRKAARGDTCNKVRACGGEILRKPDGWRVTPPKYRHSRDAVSAMFLKWFCRTLNRAKIA